MLDEGYILVKSRRRTRKPKTVGQPPIQLPLSSVCVTSIEILPKIESAKEELRISLFYQKFLETVSESLNLVSNEDAEELICYGLGSFSENISARFQLALLLLLKENLQIRVVIHDPIFSKVECDILEHFECEVIKENEEGKRKVNSVWKTLAFFPHCPKQLTNNFLWANWGVKLQNCVIISNSFTRTVESNSCTELKQNAEYIQHILPYTKEVSVVNSFRFSDIFNDLSVHIFPDLNQSSAVHLWNISEEPKYCEGDLELILHRFVPALVLG